MCDRPLRLLSSDVNGRWIIIAAKSDSSLLPLANTLAHEAGHVFLLNHGDGIDNDNTERWALGCDSAEYEKYDLGSSPEAQSLMSETPFVTRVTNYKGTWLVTLRS